MKQIFDWMREQFGKIIGEVQSPADVVWNNAVKMCITKVDEAEAKWESDCCEWKGFDNSLIEGKVMWTYKTTCKKYIPEERTSKYFRFCPYCGKPIKISEVE